MSGVDAGHGEGWQVFEGDCLAVLKTLEASSVDSAVMDPPAGIAFMAAEWDDPQAWKYPISKHGYSDGSWRTPAPGIGSARNPCCRKCKLHQRGGKTRKHCECPEPDFDAHDHLLSDRDKFVSWLTAVMRECLRVLKPGGHALVWSLPRTAHWTATALEDAGFEIRDAIHHVKDRSAEVQTFWETLSPEQRELLARAAPTDSWVQHVFGQGFPKSLNVSKAIDKAAGAERPVVGTRTLGGTAALSTAEKGGTYSAGISAVGRTVEVDVTEPATPEAVQWDGWGTGLKPAVEVWWLCRKPVEQPTVAAQVLATGTGALNIDGSRVYTDWKETDRPDSWKASGHTDKPEADKIAAPPGQGIECHPEGRWPANLLLTHAPDCVRIGTKKVAASQLDQTIERSQSASTAIGKQTDGHCHGYADAAGLEEVAAYECVPDCPVRLLDEQSGELTTGVLDGSKHVRSTSKGWSGPFEDDQGGPAARGTFGGDTGTASRYFQRFETEPPFYYTGKANARGEFVLHKNTHPTVKSDTLMQYLVRLITPPGGVVLDPFMGSGSTGVAALRLGMRFLGIEKQAEFVAIAIERLQHWRLPTPTTPRKKKTNASKGQTDLFDLFAAPDTKA